MWCADITYVPLTHQCSQFTSVAFGDRVLAAGVALLEGYGSDLKTAAWTLSDNYPPSQRQ